MLTDVNPGSPNPKQFPFQINDSFDVDEGYKTLHWHKEMEICYIKNGTGKYLINGREYVLETGDVFIINNDEIHLAYDDRDLIMNVLAFDPAILWSGGTYIMDYEYLKPFIETETNFCNKLDRGHEHIDKIIGTLTEIEDEYKRMSPGYELMIKSQLLKLMTFIIRFFKNNNEVISSSRSISPQIARKLKNTFEYIEKYYTKPLKIAELAQIAQMSIPYFCSTFKKFSGIAPIDYIIRKRLVASKDALQNTDKKISEIGIDCGFNTVSNFNHCFKLYTGLTPRQYRKSILQVFIKYKKINYAS